MSPLNGMISKTAELKAMSLFLLKHPIKGQIRKKKLKELKFTEEWYILSLELLENLNDVLARIISVWLFQTTISAL